MEYTAHAAPNAVPIQRDVKAEYEQRDRRRGFMQAVPVQVIARQQLVRKNDFGDDDT